MKDIKDVILEIIGTALRKLNYQFDLSKITIERTKQESHGDWASNVALLLHSIAKQPPRKIAEQIVEHLDYLSAGIEKVEIAGPGFINFFLGWGYYRQAVLDIIAAGEQFGSSDFGKDEKIQIEFVSANPTGPLNVVSARAAAIGDVMVNLYNTIGYKADREFYLNDAGRQVHLLGESVNSHYMTLLGNEEPFPEEGYFGEYVLDLAREIKEQDGVKFVNLLKEDRVEKLAQIALKKMIHAQKENMEKYGVLFQTWFPESKIRNTNAHRDILKILQEKGYTYENEGAVWFRSSQFGDEKDRVLLTSEGEPTYFLVDIAYHQTKYERGYKINYDIWGPDHHGYIPRMKAAILALGYPEDSFHVEIVQQVNLLRGGEVVKMSKRAGQIIEMKEVIDEVGVDAARFFFVNRKSSSHLDFDIDLAKKHTDDNPVYYVQYAHARISNILKYISEQNIAINGKTNLSLLDQDEEKSLIKKLLQYPDVILGAAQFWEPQRLTNYLQELAAAFHFFYHKQRVVSDDVELTKARLKLIEATKIVFANCLKILGISAPEYM